MGNLTIQRSYFQVGVLPSGMNTSVEVSVYITIGTTPLRHVLPPHLRGCKYNRKPKGFTYTDDDINKFNNVPLRTGNFDHFYIKRKSLKLIFFSLPVPPSYSRYSHSSGEIEDYDSEDYQKGKTQNVYTYYKMLYKRTDSMEEVT